MAFPIDPTDPDPATAVDADPTASAVELLASTIAPGGYGGLYRDGSSLYAGFTSNVDGNTALLRLAFPSLELRGFLVQHAWDALTAITNEITDTMTADTSGQILSVTPDETQNTVQVGVADPNSPEALSLAAQYGNAISIFQDDPIQLLSGANTLAIQGTAPAVSVAAARSPAPGRDDFHDPVLAGLHISGDGTHCTAGFGYTERTLGIEHGVMTAGHCFTGQPRLTEWRQGVKTLGTFSRTRDINNSTADAGTISTDLGFIRFRSVSNQVFIAPNAATVSIVKRAALNSGRRSDVVCTSGAYGGFACGALVAGGQGGNYKVAPGFTLRNVYKASFSGPILPGDSGAPVFTADGVALGIMFAANSRNPRVGFYSQIRNAENQLNVVTNTG
ncbi:MAG TPA: trypsin-like serine protease [Solirubrobacteraceae bacterium]